LKDQNIEFNKGATALVLASTSYDILNMDKFFAANYYPFQSYIISAEPYHEKILIKNIFFNKELLPGLYDTEKDDISRFKIFLLNNKGEVIVKVASSYLDRVRFSEDLVKLEQKILALTSGTAQQK
ncbi:MAG: hypothetical protein LPK19_10010, partial [Hymenobacteraceae bacterium]|nr:hypothetical protein [Hymenobacteraceae bacterium]MDX5396558.1 hypothetical protein [Hymenobacteraceae bacterium]MDX5512621.1 hypothetical protein [Hymenobacteraceae bacterium]